MDLQKRLSEIEERLAKSTPGPWEVQRFDNEGGYISYQVEAFQDYDENSGPTAWCSELTNTKYAKRNAELIAHAPADLTLLLALVKEYRAALEESQFALQCMIIKCNGKMPGLTDQQVFDVAIKARDRARQALAEYERVKNG